MRAKFVNENMEENPNQRGNVDVLLYPGQDQEEIISALQEYFDDVVIEKFKGESFIVIKDPTASVEEVSDILAEFVEAGIVDYIDYSDEY